MTTSKEAGTLCDRKRCWDIVIVVAVSGKIPDIAYFHVAVIVCDWIRCARFLSEFAMNIVSANDVTYIQRSCTDPTRVNAHKKMWCHAIVVARPFHRLTYQHRRPQHMWQSQCSKTAMKLHTGPSLQ